MVKLLALPLAKEPVNLSGPDLIILLLIEELVPVAKLGALLLLAIQEPLCLTEESVTAENYHSTAPCLDSASVEVKAEQQSKERIKD